MCDLNIFKHWRVGLLGVLVTALAVYFVVSQMNMAELMTALESARYGYAVPAMILLLIGLLTRAIRWRLLLDGALPLERAFSIMNVSYLVNGIVPLRLGELARAYLATRTDPPIPLLKSGSTIVVERLLDMLAVVLILLLGIAAGPAEDYTQYALFFGAAAGGGFLFLVFLASQRDRALTVGGAIIGRIRFLPQERTLNWFGHFLDGLAPLTRPLLLLQTLLWTALSWGFSVAAGYILMFAFYETGDWGATCLFIAFASFSITLPTTVVNIGTYEASIVLALNAMGFSDPSTATAFALLVHGVNLLIYAIVGVIGFIREGVSLEQLSTGVRQIQQQTTG